MELCCFGYNHDLSRSLLGCWRAPEIAATSGSTVVSHHLTLWKQVGRRFDVTTSHNRGTLLFWLQSRPFTLAARVLEGARDRSYEWIRVGILPVDTIEASGWKIGRQYQLQQRNFVVLATILSLILMDALSVLGVYNDYAGCLLKW